MLDQENREICWTLLTKYGVEHQRILLVEECSELQKAVCKLFRAEKDQHGYYLNNFREELVDVIVMCQQTLLAEGIDMEMVNLMAKNKLERALNQDN